MKDSKEDAEHMANRLVNIRLWDSEGDKKKTWAKSVKDMNYEILLVSQFTLFAKLKGNKPDFHYAMSSNQYYIYLNE